MKWQRKIPYFFRKKPEEVLRSNYVLAPRISRYLIGVIFLSALFVILMFVSTHFIQSALADPPNPSKTYEGRTDCTTLTANDALLRTSGTQNVQDDVAYAVENDKCYEYHAIKTKVLNQSQTFNILNSSPRDQYIDYFIVAGGGGGGGGTAGNSAGGGGGGGGSKYGSETLNAGVQKVATVGGGGAGGADGAQLTNGSSGGNTVVEFSTGGVIAVGGGGYGGTSGNNGGNGNIPSGTTTVQGAGGGGAGAGRSGNWTNQSRVEYNFPGGSGVNRGGNGKSVLFEKGYGEVWVIVWLCNSSFDTNMHAIAAGGGGGLTSAGEDGYTKRGTGCSYEESIHAYGGNGGNGTGYDFFRSGVSVGGLSNSTNYSGGGGGGYVIRTVASGIANSLKWMSRRASGNGGGGAGGEWNAGDNTRQRCVNGMVGTGGGGGGGANEISNDSAGCSGGSGVILLRTEYLPDSAPIASLSDTTISKQNWMDLEYGYVPEDYKRQIVIHSNAGYSEGKIVGASLSTGVSDFDVDCTTSSYSPPSSSSPWIIPSPTSSLGTCSLKPKANQPAGTYNGQLKLQYMNNRPGSLEKFMFACDGMWTDATSCPNEAGSEDRQFTYKVRKGNLIVETDSESKRIEKSTTYTAPPYAGNVLGNYGSRITLKNTGTAAVHNVDLSIDDAMNFELVTINPTTKVIISDGCNRVEPLNAGATVVTNCYIRPKMVPAKGVYKVDLNATGIGVSASAPYAATTIYNFTLTAGDLYVDPITFGSEEVGYPTIDPTSVNVKNQPSATQSTSVKIANTNNRSFTFSCSGNNVSPAPTTPVDLSSYGVVTDNWSPDIASGGSYTNCNIAPKSGLPKGEYTTVIRVIEQGPASGGDYKWGAEIVIIVTFSVVSSNLVVTAPVFATEDVGYSPLEFKQIKVVNTGVANAKTSSISLTNIDDFEIQCNGNPFANGAIKIISPGQEFVDCEARPKPGLGKGTYMTNIIARYDTSEEAKDILIFRVGSSSLVVSSPIFEEMETGYTVGTNMSSQNNTITALPLTLTNVGDIAANEIEAKLPSSSAFEFVKTTAKQNASLSHSSKNPVQSDLSDAMWTVRPKINLPRGTYVSTITVEYAYGGETMVSTTDVSFRVKAPDVRMSIVGFDNARTGYSITNVASDENPGNNIFAPHTIIATNLGDSDAEVQDVSITNTASFEFICDNNDLTPILTTFSSWDKCQIVPKTGLLIGTHSTSVVLAYSEKSGAIRTITALVSFSVVDSDVTFDVPLFNSAPVGYQIGSDPGEIAQQNIHVTNSGGTDAWLNYIYPDLQAQPPIEEGFAFNLDGDQPGAFEITRECENVCNADDWRVPANSYNETFIIAPKPGLAQGVYKANLKMTLSNGKTVIKQIQFQVLAPRLLIEVPLFRNASQGYIQSAIMNLDGQSSDGSIKITNVGETLASIDLTASNADIYGSGSTDPKNAFILHRAVSVGSHDTVDVAATNSSWRILPKVGLNPGTYTSNVTVDYGSTGSGSLKQTLSVSFTVVAASLDIKMPVYLDANIDYSSVSVTPADGVIQVKNNGEVDTEFKVYISDEAKSDWDLTCSNGTTNDTPFTVVFLNQTLNTDCILMPKQGLTYGTHYVTVYFKNTITDHITASVATFKVLTPSIEVLEPHFFDAIIHYQSIVSSSANGQITLYNQGDTTATNITITATNADINTSSNPANAFVLKQGNNSVARNTKDTSWEIMPKIGLAAGIHYSTLQILYGPNHELAKVVTVSFKVLSPEIQIDIDPYTVSQIGYMSNEHDILLTNKGNTVANVSIALKDGTYFELNGDCGSVARVSVNPFYGTSNSCKILPKSNLLVGDYTDTVLVEDHVSGEIYQKDVRFEVKGANLTMSTPIFPDEIFNYTTYDNDSSAVPIKILNLGQSSTDIEVTVTDINVFNILEDTTSVDCENGKSRQIGFSPSNLNGCYRIKPFAGLAPGYYVSDLVVHDISSNATNTVSISFKVTAPSLSISDIGFANTPSTLVYNVHAASIAINNRGDGDATDVRVQLLDTQPYSDAFELIGPTESELELEPSEHINIPAFIGFDALTWKIKPRSDLVPGYYSTVIYVRDALTGVNASRLVSFVVTGAMFDYVKLDADKVIEGYQNISIICQPSDDNANILAGDEHCGDQKTGIPLAVKNVSSSKIKLEFDISSDNFFVLGKYNPEGLCENLSVRHIGNIEVDSDATLYDYCVSPKLGLSRGEYTVDVAVTDANSGQQISQRVHFVVTAPSISIQGKTLFEKRLDYTTPEYENITVRNTGDAKGYYAIKIDNTDVFDLLDGYAPVESGVDGLSTRVKPKDGLQRGTYVTVATLYYSPAPLAKDLSIYDDTTTNPALVEAASLTIPLLPVNANQTDSSQSVHRIVSTFASDECVNDPEGVEIPEDELGFDGIECGNFDVSLVKKSTTFITFKVMAAALHVNTINFTPDEPANIPYGNISSEKITIQNYGDGLADIEDIVSSSPDFVIQSGAWQVIPGSVDSSWSVYPKSDLPAGTHDAVLTVKDRAGVVASGYVHFEVIEPDLAISVPSFGQTVEGYAPIDEQEMVINNNGYGEALIDDIVSETPDFDIYRGSGSVSSKSTDKSWHIKPRNDLPAGDYVSTITLHYNGQFETSATTRIKIYTASEFRELIKTIDKDSIQTMMDWLDSQHNATLSSLRNDLANLNTDYNNSLAKFPWWVIVLLFIIIACIAGGAFFVYNKQKRRVKEFESEVYSDEFANSQVDNGTINDYQAQSIDAGEDWSDAK